MIAELFLIVDLLKRSTSQIGPPVPPATIYEPPQGGQYPMEYGKPPDAPKPIFEVDPEVFADVIKLKRYF
tara:strand:- start:288 stop:497 length:210 start_codon:yes stop_codon:yes gene_type:complete